MTTRGFAAWTTALLAIAILASPGPVQAHHPPVHTVGRIAPRQQKPEQIFQSVCSACHGPKGKGNGPAGAAFNPHPANFTDPAFWKSRTDDELVHSITNGKGMMPPFGATYDAATIKALVQYLHALSGLHASGAPPAP